MNKSATSGVDFSLGNIGGKDVRPPVTKEELSAEQINWAWKFEPTAKDTDYVPYERESIIQAIRGLAGATTALGMLK